MSSTSWFRRRKFFKVFTKYGPGNHLGYVTRNIWTNFHPNIPWRLHKKFGFKQPNFFKETKLEMLNLSDLGQRSVNDHDLGLSQIVVYSFIWLYVPTVTSKASIVSWKSTAWAFSHTKTNKTKFDLAVKYVKVNSGSSFEQIWQYSKNQCCTVSFMIIGLLVPDKKIFEGFYHIWAWRPSWLCEENHKFVFTFIPPSHGGSTWNLASISLVVSKEKKFEDVETEWS